MQVFDVIEGVMMGSTVEARVNGVEKPWCRNYLGLPYVLITALLLPSCGKGSPTSPGRVLIAQGDATFPRPDISGVFPLFAVVNFNTTTRGGIEVLADWRAVSNSFLLSLRSGTCGVSNNFECSILLQSAAGLKPASLSMADLPAAGYTLVILVAPSSSLVPDTVSYQVFAIR
jgi:hypothetical protein